MAQEQQQDKDYIGDGVYVYHDGYQIWLETQRERSIERIALEYETYNSLKRYAKRIGFDRSEK